MLNAEQRALLGQLQKLALARGETAYVVGGIVRDLFLGQDLQDNDLDFIIEANALEFARALHQQVGGELKEFPDFFTAKIENPKAFPAIAEIDLASVRIEVYQRPGELPKVTLAQSIEEDLKRRDFSINAMALRVDDLIQWLNHSNFSLAVLRDLTTDFFDGRRDLDHKVVRVLHERSFLDDPTRIFRACRYAARLQGNIDQRSAELIRHAVAEGALESISHFRKLTELKRIWEEKQPFAALGLLLSFAVFERFPIFDATQTEQLFGSLARLAQNVRSSCAALRFDAFLALCLDSFSTQEGRESFKSLGVGKKQLGHFTEALERARAFADETPTQLSDLELALALSLDEESSADPALRAEAERRKLSNAQLQ